MQEQNDVIEIIRPTPKLRSRRCKMLAFLIAAALTYGSYAIALATWYFYGLFYGIASFLIAYLVIGIVRSKLRNGAIPFSQQEYHYNDKAIAAWYVDRELLCR